MRVQQDTVILSATDLANHLSCRHLTALDFLLAKRQIAEPSWDKPHLHVLQQRGFMHEKAYVESSPLFPQGGVLELEKIVRKIGGVGWGTGRAYRLVREYREEVARRVFEPISEAARNI